VGEEHGLELMTQAELVKARIAQNEQKKRRST
jgi:hypothetical protein